MKIIISIILLLIFNNLFSQPITKQDIKNIKPWTYWWWMGSTVDRNGITLQLENFKKSGLGGAHIIPIYGVKGEEPHFLPFLGTSWLEIFNFTCTEANRLGLGIDLSTGTGWPFGGPSVTQQNIAKQLVFHEFKASDTLRINDSLRKSIYAKADIFLINPDETYTRIDNVSSVNQLSDNELKKILIITYEPTNQKVKRAAPGGEGLVIDHFSPHAMRQYLEVFDSTLFAFKNNQAPRAMYNDSYEVYNANWTTDFFEKFRMQHHYDLSENIFILSPNYRDSPHKVKLFSDYRETLSDLLQESEKTWSDWASGHKILTRYQAHGSPGNLLDLYALADIPETESFGSSNFKIPGVRLDTDYEEKNFGRPNPLMMKFASSPAHLLGKKLVASESTTWLGNHFKVALSQIKPQLDELFTAGINHLFFHGTTYSPPDLPFPGWLFYASTNYGVYSHFYNEFPLLNQYITACQKLLQESEPDNDILVYLPIYDFWANTKEPLLSLFSVHHAEKWFLNTPFGKMATHLWENGYGFDYISDQQISQLAVNKDHSVSIGKSRYQTILIPRTTHMTLETLQNLAALSRKGVSVIFDQSLPMVLPGNGRDFQQSQFNALKEEFIQNPKVLIGSSDSALKNRTISHENLSSSGLSFIRKKTKTGHLRFITNLSDKFYNDTISISEKGKALEYYNPMTGDRGFIDFKNKPGGMAAKLYLPPGSSCFLIIYNQKQKGKRIRFPYPSTESIELSEWEVKFSKGSPVIPVTIFHPEKLTSWTTWKDSALQWFNGYGTYTTKFSLPNVWHNRSGIYINIEDLRETARITINEKSVGTIWAVPFQIFISNELLKFGQRNSISIEVRNLSANEARYLDSKQIYWKKFYDANIVDITYKPFDATKWDPVPSGILGKVKIIAAD